MSFLRFWGLGIVSLALSSSGCAYYATSHLPYTPLLDHAGQVDVSVRTGLAYPGGLPVAVNAAIAVADGLEIVANGDVNLGSGARHYGGGIGIGTFVPTDVFRLELIGGVNGGYANGVSSSFDVDASYQLSGGYLQPFGQLMLGLEVPHFVFAGGVRVQGFLAESTAVPDDGSAILYDGYERAYAEPILTFQFPFDIVRVEVTASLPIVVAGDASPVSAALIDSAFQFYLAAGVGFQWDSFAEPEPLPEPEPIYAPAYAPPPSAPPPAPIPLETPVAPAGYESPPPAEPAPEPAPATPPPATEPEDTSPFRPAAP